MTHLVNAACEFSSNHPRLASLIVVPIAFGWGAIWEAFLP